MRGRLAAALTAIKQPVIQLPESRLMSAHNCRAHRQEPGIYAKQPGKHRPALRCARPASESESSTNCRYACSARSSQCSQRSLRCITNPVSASADRPPDPRCPHRQVDSTKRTGALTLRICECDSTAAKARCDHLSRCYRASGWAMRSRSIACPLAIVRCDRA